MSDKEKQDRKAVPFFARFLEGQNIAEMSEEESEAIGGGHEGEDREIVTLKYPSDDEDGGVMTEKFPSDQEDGGRPVTRKFPSDQEDGNGRNRRRQLIRRWLQRRRGNEQDD